MAALPGAADIDVVAQRLTYPLASTEPLPQTEGPSSIVLVHSDGFEDAVRVTEGELPRSLEEAGADVLETLAPVASRLTVGTELTLGDRGSRVVVVGLWEPVDADNPLWFGDPGLVTGTVTGVTTGAAEAVGPLFVANDDDLLPTVDRARQRWILTPAPTIDAEHLGEVATALSVAPDRLRTAGVYTQGSSVAGTGVETFAELAARSAEVAARGTTAAALVAVAGGVGILAVSSVLVRMLSPRTRVLFARGARVTQVAAVDVPALLVATVLGAVLGAGLALLAGAMPALALRWSLGAVAVGLVAVLVLTRRRLPLDQRRPGLWRALGVTLVVVLAALALWRLLTGGLLVGSGGRVRADLAAALAVPLLLALVGAAVAVALRPLASGGARLARRGLTALLTLRRLARHPRLLLGAGAAVTGGAILLALRAAGSPDPLGGPLTRALLGSAVAAAALTALVWVALADERSTGRGSSLAAIGVGSRTDAAGWIVGDIVTLLAGLAAGAGVATALVSTVLGAAATVGGAG